MSGEAKIQSVKLQGGMFQGSDNPPTIQHETQENPLGMTPGGDGMATDGKLAGGGNDEPQADNGDNGDAADAGANGGPVTREEFDKLQQMVRELLAKSGAGPKPPMAQPPAPAQAAAPPQQPPAPAAPQMPQAPQQQPQMQQAGGYPQRMSALQDEVARLRVQNEIRDTVTKLRSEYQARTGQPHPMTEAQIATRLSEMQTEEGRRERAARLAAMPPPPTDELSGGPEGASGVSKLRARYGAWRKTKEDAGEKVELGFDEWAKYQQ